MQLVEILESVPLAQDYLDSSLPFNTLGFDQSQQCLFSFSTSKSTVHTYPLHEHFQTIAASIPQIKSFRLPAQIQGTAKLNGDSVREEESNEDHDNSISYLDFRIVFSSGSLQDCMYKKVDFKRL